MFVRIEEYETAMKEWEENRPPGSATGGSTQQLYPRKAIFWGKIMEKIIKI
jgi:hypothetical protein